MAFHHGVIDFYNESAKTVQDDARAMGWSSVFNQTLRFDVMNFLLDFHQRTILDVGCGDGALFHYLKDRDIEATYKGIDIAHEMIHRGQRRYPGIPIRQCNVFDYTESHDVVVCSGGLSMSDGDDPGVFFQHALNHLYRLANEHLIFNLLSDHETKKDPAFNYYSPIDVARQCFEKTPYVTMHHGYLPNDVTFHLVKMAGTVT